MATLATQPLIVAKVGLQSKPPPARQGKPFKGFIEVMQFIVKHEGLLGLFKGIAPQISKGVIVQGLLMMTKERFVCPTLFLCSCPASIHANSHVEPNRIELLFIALFRYLRKVKTEQLARAAELASSSAKQVSESAKQALPLTAK